MRASLISTMLVLVLLLALPIAAEEEAGGKEDIWSQFRFFVGQWDGHETGKAGIGKGDREYRFILDGKYLHINNKSVFEPQEKNPEGETHGDWGFFSFDGARKNFVLREFHSEGFVIQYVLDTANSTEEKMIFISESMENAPPGMKARQVFDIVSEDKFSETFELAFPGKELEVFLENHWTRRK